MKRISRQDKSMHFQNLSRKEYFEGWYYKQVSPDEKTVICFIPGVSVSAGKTSPFIQAILARKSGETWHHISEWLDFKTPLSQDEPFSFGLGDNCFRRDGISIDYRGAQIQVKGKLSFGDISSLPVSFFAPTILGPFTYLPGMECIHSVISLNHSLTGSLNINGETINFSGGKGYIEKDWGSSFPKRYVWLQSNHFSKEGSLFFSWADIPVMGTAFQGYIAHLYYGGEHHRYATYTRGGCKLTAAGQGVEIVLTNKDSELRIKAAQSGGADLIAPHRGQMIHTIKEGLFGDVSFRLKKFEGNSVIEDQTALAGVEIVWEKGEKS